MGWLLLLNLGQPKLVAQDPSEMSEKGKARFAGEGNRTAGKSGGNEGKGDRFPFKFPRNNLTGNMATTIIL